MVLENINNKVHCEGMDIYSDNKDEKITIEAS